jgi:predicted glycosyltransferase
MKVWIDLANSPHVPLFVPIVGALRKKGDEVVLTARDNAQTALLAEEAWSDVLVVGGESPGARVRKAGSILSRSIGLRRFALSSRPGIALSHGSYAQIVAARLARIPAVTMMDYEHQPANHLSFRLAQRVIVPATFPEAGLRTFGASPKKIVRYNGFKEELYLADVAPDPSILVSLGLDPARVTAAMRPPPEGALYHREGNPQFDAILEHVLAERGQVVLVPRTGEQAARYRRSGVVIPERPVDGRALLATVDLTIGAGGTMTRESALLGTRTYTVFLGKLAAVDAELIRLGKLIDLREGGLPPIERRVVTAVPRNGARAKAILDVVVRTIEAADGSARASRGRSRIRSRST